MTIPKILHFTWKTEDVPGKMGEYLAMWRDTHSDWDIRLWTDATMRVFVAETYPDFLATYDGYPRPIQRADSFRYLVLFAVGGVYADLDVEPYKSINELVNGLDCFVGIEPDEHIGPDRRRCGVPYLLSNAFMGGVPNHPYFGEIVRLLPTVSDNPNVFYSTGPSMTTAAGVRLPKADRPVLVPPCLWSPDRDGGKPCTSDDKLASLVDGAFGMVWKDRKAVVSHHWLTSWVPWHKRHKWLAKPFHAMHAIKWAARARRFPELASLPILDQLHPYDDQLSKPVKPLPTIKILLSVKAGEVISSGLVETLAALDYPKKNLSVCLGTLTGSDEASVALQESVLLLESAGFVDVQAKTFPAPKDDLDLSPENQKMARSAVLRNGLAGMAKKAGRVLFIDGEVSNIPPKALRVALAAGYPVVAMGTRDANGADSDRSTFRYDWGAGIRLAYKIRGEDGLTSATRGLRLYPGAQKAFRFVPLDGVGTGFVLIDRKVLEAGVRFAEKPYNLHLDGEGFALMARESGFEVAGLTELAVMRRDA